MTNAMDKANVGIPTATDSKVSTIGTCPTVALAHSTSLTTIGDNKGLYVDGHEAGFGKFIYATGGSKMMSKQHVREVKMVDSCGDAGI